MNIKKTLLVGLIGSIVATSSLDAAVRFFPRLIYMDIGQKFKTVYLENESGKDNIYKLSFKYTKVTPDNKFIVVDKDKITPEDRDFCGNLKVFPKKIVIGAGKRQSIMISRKNIKKEAYQKGEYYCRIYAKAMPVPQKLVNNVKNLQTNLNVVMSIGAPIHIRANPKVKLNLQVQPYGYRIKNGVFYYRVDLSNKTTMGVRGTVVIDVFDKKTGEKVKTFQHGFINQTGKTIVFFKQKIKGILDFKNHEYEAKSYIIDSDGVELKYHLFDYNGIPIENFNLK